MMYSKRHLPDIEQWSQSSGSNVITRRARPGLAGLKPHSARVLLAGGGVDAGEPDVSDPQSDDASHPGPDASGGGTDAGQPDVLTPNLTTLLTSSFFFFTHVTGPRRSLSLNLSDTRVYEPQIRTWRFRRGFRRR